MCEFEEDNIDNRGFRHLHMIASDSQDLVSINTMIISGTQCTEPWSPKILERCCPSTLTLPHSFSHEKTSPASSFCRERERGREREGRESKRYRGERERQRRGGASRYEQQSLVVVPLWNGSIRRKTSTLSLLFSNSPEWEVSCDRLRSSPKQVGLLSLCHFAPTRSEIIRK